MGVATPAIDPPLERKSFRSRLSPIVDTTLENQPHLADYVRPVWQRKWLILFVVVLATGATYAYSTHHRNVYEAGTLVFYQPATDPLAAGSTPATDRAVGDVAALLYAQDNAAAVARQIGYRGSLGQLVSQVTISSRTGQDFVAINGSSGDPRQAAAIANGYARRLVTITNASQQAQIAQQLQGLQRELTVTRGSTQDAAGSRQTLNTQIAALESALRIPTGTRQVSPAAVPSSPSSPKPVRDAIFAFVLGLALAIAAAYGLARFDRRIKEPEDLARHYGLPLLGALPHSPDPAPRQGSIAGLGPEFQEAFGLLRTNIQLLALDAPPRSLVVASALPGEGKSTVVRSLAITLAEAGKRVVVVEADLRRPMQSSFFGLPAGPGLTEVLTGVADLSEVLHQVPVQVRGVETLAQIGAAAQAEGSGNGRPTNLAHSAVSVLLAGVHPPNPATVLESHRVLEVLDQLSATHDILILDSAPLLSVTDSVPLVRYADATVIVGRLNLVTRDGVRRMTSFLGRMPDARVLGVIANDLSELDSVGYGYGYGYGARASAGAGAPATPSRNEPAANL